MGSLRPVSPAPVEFPFYFTSDDINCHEERYTEIVADLLSGHAQDYDLDSKAFAHALLDVEQDLNILYFRRLKNGISDGKQAGIFTFRLARTPIIHMVHPQQSGGCCAQKINALVGFCFACKTIKLKPEDIPLPLRTEILYNPCFRHTNQETLGIIFDTFYCGNRSSTVAGSRRVSRPCLCVG